VVSHWESRPQPNVQGEERSQQHDARRLGRRTASASSNPSDDPAGDSRNQPNRKAPDHHREGKRHPGLSVAVAIQNRAEDPIAHGGHNRLGDDSRDRSGNSAQPALHRRRLEALPSRARRSTWSLKAAS